MVKYVVLYCIAIFSNIDGMPIITDCEHHKEFISKKDAVKFCDELKEGVGFYKKDLAKNVRLYELKDTIK